MATNHERVTTGLGLLVAGLRPFVERELEAEYGDAWLDAAAESFREGRERFGDGDDPEWDAQSLLAVMWNQWNQVFRRRLGHRERSLVSELREYRNDWAHQRPFDHDDAYRLLDGIGRLLTAVEADGTESIGELKRELRREQVDHDVIDVPTIGGMRDWRMLLALYGVCAALIVATLLSTFGPESWVVSALVIAFFAFTSYELVTQRRR